MSNTTTTSIPESPTTESKPMSLTFAQLNGLLQKHVLAMTTKPIVAPLFVVNLDKDQLWNLYLDSFPAGTNEIYRKRREFDCSCCRSFVKALGNVVTIKDGVVTTIWGFDSGDPTFQPVLDALDAFVKSHPVADVFVSKFLKFGTEKTIEELDNDEGTRVWNHFFVTLPGHLQYRKSATEDTERGRLRDLRNVMKRGFDELAPEAFGVVLELIASNTLYRGEEWRGPLTTFLGHQERYLALPPEQRDLRAWELATMVSESVAKIRNHSIGTLLIDISQGLDLDVAVRKYEAVVAPTNYKRPQAVFTAKMLEEAKRALEADGLMESLPRRFAQLDDISVRDVLFANRDAATKMRDGSVFDELRQGVPQNPKQFARVEEIPVGVFMTSVLPYATTLEVFLENRHSSSLASLIAPMNPDKPSLFKWDNGFSWAYKNNLADSMKERVKEAGGEVDGELRFSIQWNDDGKSIVDLDAHAYVPGAHIYFRDKHPWGANGGFLDVDMISPWDIGVENISWPRGTKMRAGVYRFQVHNFSGHRDHSGFDAEIEIDGEVHTFSYRQPFTDTVDVAEVTIDSKGQVSIKSLLPSDTKAPKGRKLWGLDTGHFHPVTICTQSPNYWGDWKVGHRHYFFMLAGCQSDETPSGFFNEYLREEYMKHKRVLEALGAKMRVEPSPNQLSGLGFSATKRDTLIVRVGGQVSRTLKVLF